MDIGSNPQSESFEDGASLINKSGFDDTSLENDIEESKPIANVSVSTFTEAEKHGDEVGSYEENFSQSEIVDMVNDQIQSDFGEYLREDAQPMDIKTVEINPGTEFGDNSQYGYYDWYNSGKLVVNQDAGGTVETLIHEGLHMATDNGNEIGQDGELVHHLGIEDVSLDPDSGDIQAVSNLNLNEGITEMFTRESAKNMGINDISIAYPAEVEVAESLSHLVGGDVVRDAYFNSDVDSLRASVDSKLGQGAFDMINVFMDFGAPYAAMTIFENGMPVDQDGS